MSAETVARALGGKRVTEGNYNCHCPAHEDGHPSLSVKDGDKGVVVHCFAGCSQDKVIAALRSKGLWEKKTNGKQIITTYNYTDEKGQLAYQVVRFAPKDFRQRKPDGAGGWSWTIKGVKTLPYQLPEVLEAIKAKKPIFIVEGEKDVDTLRSHGYTATCNSGGAGKWTKAHAMWLRGADAIIVPDNDEPGRKHAELVSRSLAGIASTGTLNLEDGIKDVTEWFERGGGSREKLDELIAAYDRNPLHQIIKPTDAKAAVEGEGDLPPEFSDDALALEFTRRHGKDLRYVAAWGKWLRWTGARWEEDRTIRVFDLAREVCRDAAGEAEEKLGRQITSAKTIAAVEKLARSDPKHATLPEELDADALLFNCPGGTVDLRTGELRPHRREDLITKIAGTTPDHEVDDSVWIRFLADITFGDLELENYLQRLVGYCLSGDTTEHVLAFMHGVGANGKSTLIDLLLYVFGDYGKLISTETLMEARGERHPTDVANLLGVRLAVSSEVEEGQHWAESRLKALTGDAVLTGRFMRQDFFEFKRTHKLVVAGNHRPAIRTVDEAMRRRIHLIPFRARFTGAKLDRLMPEKLRAEAPAVLAWAIRGFLEWQAGGLQPPQTVTAATVDYLDSQDTLGLWLAEKCATAGPTTETSSSTLYDSFKVWKERRGERPPSQVRFSGQLEARYRRERSSRTGHMVFIGLGLKHAD